MTSLDSLVRSPLKHHRSAITGRLALAAFLAVAIDGGTAVATPLQLKGAGPYAGVTLGKDGLPLRHDDTIGGGTRGGNRLPPENRWAVPAPSPPISPAATLMARATAPARAVA